MSLKQQLEEDKISSLPLRKSVEVPPSTSALDAVTKMKASGLGCAVIVDSNGKPQGIFTESSVIEMLDSGVDLRQAEVADYADPKFVYVTDEEPVLNVWRTIQQDHARFICVTDSEGKFLGLTGQRGLSEYIAECFPMQVMVQRLGETPWSEQREGA